MVPKCSDVWKHFISEGSNSARCKVCSQLIQRCGNTTNMWAHLRSKHNITKPKGKTSVVETPEPDEDIDDPGEVSGPAEQVVGSSNNRTTPTTSRNCNATLTLSPAPAARSSSASTTDAESAGRGSTGDSGDPQQLQTKRMRTVPIDQAFNRQSSFGEGGNKHQTVTEAILFMIIKDCLPFNTPHKEGFKNLMKVCCPLYKGVSRYTVTRLVDGKFDLISEKMKTMFSLTPNFALTCDIWTDIQKTQSYLGVTAHFLNTENMEMESIMIEVMPMNERHTDLNIATELEKICQKWNIDTTKVTAVVTDNGANIKCAVELWLGPGKHLPCLAHSLNLVVPEAMKVVPEIEILKDKVKAIVSYFKRSVSASDALRKQQERAGDKILKLKQDVPTRFYSTFIMLERFNSVKDHVASVLTRSPGGPDMLSGVELKRVDELLKLLQPFQRAITELSAEKSVTASKVIPLINCVRTAIQISPASSPSIQQLKSKILFAIDKRFGSVEKNLLFAISTLVDPRFKRIHFKDVVAHGSAIQKASELVKTHQGSLSNSVDTDSAEGLQPQSGSSLWSHHSNLLASMRATATEPDMDEIPLELQQFLNQLPSHLSDDPFKLWKTLQLVYPSVYQIALVYLAVPASSVPCERLFSKAGRLVADDRNRLDSKRIGKLCFLSSLDLKYWPQ